MGGTPDQEVPRNWVGLSLTVRLSQAGTEFSSEEVGALLETRNVKGIGGRVIRNEGHTGCRGDPFVEAAVRRTVRCRRIWSAGPRIRQAINVLEQERYRWTVDGGRKIYR